MPSKPRWGSSHALLHQHDVPGPRQVSQKSFKSSFIALDYHLEIFTVKSISKRMTFWASSDDFTNSVLLIRIVSNLLTYLLAESRGLHRTFCSWTLLSEQMIPTWYWVTIIATRSSRKLGQQSRAEGYVLIMRMSF